MGVLARRPRDVVQTSKSVGAAVGSGILSGLGSSPSATGLLVSQTTALTVSTVYACVRIRAGSLARCSPKVMRVDGAGRQRASSDYTLAALFQRPNRQQTWYEFVDALYAQRGGPPDHSVLTVRAPPAPTVAPVLATATSDDRAAEATRLAAYERAQQIGPIHEANTALDAQNALLKVQIDIYGQSADKIAGATEKQKLIDDYLRQGVPITSDLSAAIDQLGDRYADLAKRQADVQALQQKIVGAMDDLRSVSKDALGTFISDLRDGKSAAEAFGDVLSHIESKVLDIAENQAIDSLLGKPGSPGGGLLGGTFSSLFGALVGHNAGGTDDWRGGPTWVGEQGPEIVNLPAHSTVMPALASMQVAAAATGTGRLRSQQTITFNVTSPDAPSFAASRTQIEALLSRAAARGQRNA